MKKDRIVYFAIPIFFLLMLIDVHLTRAFLTFSNGAYIWNVHLLLLSFMFGAQVFSKRYMIITSLVLGIIFDLYYIGVLGIYAIVLPLLVWAMYLLYDTLFENPFTMFFGMIILVTLQELATAGIQLLFHLTTINGAFFVARFLGPTLLINIGLFVLAYFPFKKLFAIE